MSNDFNDEVDIAMACMISDKEEQINEALVESANEYVLLSEEDNVVDTLNIQLDESDTDPIGMEAEEIITTEQELLLGDTDSEIIDMMM